MHDEHGKLAVCGILREPLLLLVQRGQRRFSNLEMRQLTEDGALRRRATGARRRPAIGLDSIARLNDASRRSAIACGSR